jgi:GGDEF domain-containing protein
MAIINRRTALVALGAASAGVAGWAITGSPGPAVATSCVGALEIGVRNLMVRRRTRRAVEAVAEGDGTAEDSLNQGELLAALGRDVARAERYGDPMTLCFVRMQEHEQLSPAAMAAAEQHLGASLERVTRASDSWFAMGKGTFAVILERCTAADATYFAERLSIATGSRPLIVEGKRVHTGIAMAHTEYDPHQFVGAADFLSAARTSRFQAPGKRERLVADGRFLRQHIYGKDHTAGAA